MDGVCAHSSLFPSGIGCIPLVGEMTLDTCSRTTYIGFTVSDLIREEKFANVTLRLKLFYVAFFIPSLVMALLVTYTLGHLSIGALLLVSSSIILCLEVNLCKLRISACLAGVIISVFCRRIVLENQLACPP